MKIVYIANIRLPTEKAHGIQIMKMCEAFAALGHEVELVVPRRLNPIKGDPFSFYETRKSFKITKIPCLDLIFLSGKLLFLLEFVSFLIFAKVYLVFKKYDLVYTRDVMTGYFFNNLILELHSLPKTIGGADKIIFGKAQKIAVLTSFIKDELIDIGVSREKILVSPDATDLSQFEIGESVEELRKRYDLPLDKKIITYAGKFKTMGQSKGVDNIIKSFPAILRDYNNSFLLLVGVNDDEAEEIKEVFKELKISEGDGRVVGHVSQRVLFCYMKMSDILVMNYPNAKHYAHYMSPLKLFEYMASGKPIVSSDLPSIREILNEQNSILVKADNLESLSSGIKTALIDEDASGKIAKQAKIDVREYTWDKRALKIINFLK